MAKRRGSAKNKAAAAAEPEVSGAESSDWEIDQPQKATTPRKPAARVLEKDADEEDLERLVLGDHAGFRAQLFGSLTVEDAGQSMNELSLVVAGRDKPDGEDADEDGDEAEAEADEKDEFEDADDAHMFLYDDTLEPNTALAAGGAAAATKDGGSARDEAPYAAWEDSDDERLSVSLAGQNRLRKLRRTQGEDIVNGAEYAARLRQQFLRLHPQPAWATQAIKARQKLDDRLEGKRAPKKRKTKRSGDGGSDASDASDDSLFSDDDDDGDDDADAEDDGEVDSAALPLDKFFRSAGALAGASQLLAQHHGAKKRRLRPEVLDIQKTRDVATVHTGPVTSLSFHPQYAVLLSASLSCTLHLHQLAPTAHPTPNPLLTSVRVRHTPVRRAAFVAPPPVDEDDAVATATVTAQADAQPQIVFAGRRRFFHTWDLATGRVQRITGVQGHRLEQRTMERFRASPTGAHLALVASERKGGGMLNILSMQTMQWVAQARLDSRGGIADFQWWRDGSGITLLGKDGRVGEWSLATRRFVGTWRDDGSVGGTVLGLGGRQGPAALGGDRWVAIGSSSGITNLYDRTALLATATATATETQPTLVPHPTPMKVFEQLTTPVTEVVFSPDGQLLAFASQLKRDALRLAHLPTGTVYRNWPTAQTPLGRITAVAFSRESNLLAVGNDVGKTRLWEIRG